MVHNGRELKSGGVGNTLMVKRHVMGDIVSFADGADAPVHDMVVNIEPVQSGSGDPSPDNVRPINGWDGVNVTVSPTLDAEDGTTYPITFPSEAGTVYGGYVDVTTGELNRTNIYYNPTAFANLNWSIQKTSGDYTLFTYRNDVYTKSESVDAIYCSSLKYIPYTSAYYQNANAPTYADKTITIVDTRRLYVWSTKKTVAEFKQWLIDISAEAAIKRLTPYMYTITPTEVMTLLGQNNIFADSGSVDVTYIADSTITMNNIKNAITSLGGNV